MSDGLLEQLRSRYPQIEWERPVGVEVFETGVRRLCCRVCIASQGITGQQVAERGFESVEDFEAHMETVHGG